MNEKLVFAALLASAAIAPAFVVSVRAEDTAITDGTYEVNFLT